MQVLTANRLVDGIVVYLTAKGGWSERFAEGHAVDDETGAEALMRRAERSVAACQVVAPYLIEVAPVNDTLAPSSARERIRAFGPSVSAGTGAALERE